MGRGLSLKEREAVEEGAGGLYQDDDGDEEKRRAGHTARSGAKNGPPILKMIGQGLTQTRHYTRKG
jgi:hypothetical protein